MLINRLRSNYTLNIINKIYVCIIGIITTAITTRYLSISFKGQYSYIIQLVNLLMLVFDLGINQAYPYFYKQNNGNISKRFIDLYFAQGSLYVLLCYPLAYLARNDVTYFGVLVLLPIAVMCRQLESTMAVENIRLKILVHMINATVKCVLSGALYVARNVVGVYVIFPVLIVIIIDVVTIMVYLIALKVKPSFKSFDLGFTKKVLAYSWLPMLTSVLITVNYNIDIIFLKHIGSAEQLSIYTTAAGIINYIWLIPDAFKEVLVSKVVRRNGVSEVNRAIRLSLLSIFIVCAGFVVLGRLFISLLYGKEFLSAYQITIVLVIGCFSMVFYKVIGVLMLAEGKREFYFVALFISALMNIIGNYIFIPAFGMYGAAWVSVVSYTVCGMAFLIYYMKTKNVGIISILWKETSHE